MNKLQIVVLSFPFLASASIFAACGGSSDPAPSGGSGGSGGGGMMMADLPCPDVALVCATAGCHDSTTHQSGMDLSGDITKYIDKAVDVPNDPDALAVSCGAPDSKAKTAKIIDSKAPEMSLMYTKLLATFPCGVKMPELDVKKQWKSTDPACVLSWIKTVTGAKSGTGADGG
jgi:hypothetical protein